MMKNKSTWNDSGLLNHLASELGYTVDKITSRGNRHTLKISDGKKFYIANAGSYGYYPSNNRWHTALFKNKIQTKAILQEINYPCVISHNYTIKENDIQDTLKELKGLDLNYPLIVKPSQGMKGQGIKFLDNFKILEKEVTVLYKEGTDFCVQPIIKDTEYRVLFVNGLVHLVHTKSYNSITGDGTKSVSELLSEKSDNYIDNTFLEHELRQGHLDKNSILEEDKTLKTHITKITHGVHVNDIYFKDSIPEAVSKWTKGLADNLSVSVMGLDIFASDINDPNTYKIIEINSNPAFSYIVNKFNGYQQIKEMWKETLRIYFSN